MWHRVRFDGGSLEAALEQNEFLRKISSSIMNRAVGLANTGMSLKQSQAEILSHWEGDDKVWHLNDVALSVYHAVGGTRSVEATVSEVPPAKLQALLLSTIVFDPA
jgi:hypothetical protein